MKKITSTLLILALCMPVTAMATDGTFGTTSTGEIALSLSVSTPPEAQIEITGLLDINLGDVVEGDPVAPATIDNICVRLSTPVTYSINISSQNGAGNSGSLEDLDGISTNYSWEYTDSTGNVTSGATGTGLTGSTQNSCSDGNTASITITPTSTTSGLALFGFNTYSDILTLTVSPE